jgi:hypothetical protein
MTATDLELIVRGVVPAVREFIATQLRSYAERIAVLETRAPVPGPQGEKGIDGQSVQGERGEKGDPGDIGPAGATGPEGPAGPPGPMGPTGEKGADGLMGKDGLQGPPGRDGLPGVPGAQGQRGEAGLQGKDGLDGAPGRDGTLEHLKMAFDGQRTLTFMRMDGAIIEGGIVKMDIPIYRGVHVAGKLFERADMVTYAGSTWFCNEATVTRPGESATAWTLVVKRGRDGKDA